MEPWITKASFLVGITLEFLILYFLVKRRLQRRFFWFLVYIVYEILESLLRFSVAGKALYDPIYWWTEIGEASLAVLAFRESFLNVFRGYTRLRWFVSVVWGCIGLALLYALFRVLVFPPVQANRRGTIIIDLEVAINFVLIVMAILYFALAGFFRIRGHQFESGIISGFAIYISLAICSFLIRSIFGTKFVLVNVWLIPMGYILAAATWALELSLEESLVSKPTHELTVDDLTNLGHYGKVLERFFRGKA